VEIHAFLSEHYFDQEFVSKEWPKVHREAKARIAKSLDADGGYRAIQDALKAFGHSHLSYFPPWSPMGIVVSGRTGGWQMDFDIYEVDGHLRVGRVREEGGSHGVGLRNGMRILKIDGVSVEEILKHGAPLFEAYRLVDRCPWGKLNLMVEGKRRPKRRGEELSVQLEKYHGPMSRFGHAAIPKKMSVEKRKDGVLYIAFNAFTFDQVSEVKGSIQKNRDSKGVILDIRGNQGGVGALGPAIALEFCTKAYSFGKMKGREMNLRFPVFPQATVHPGPVAILTDERSFSTSEIMARGMQLAKTAKVFGRRTPGKALPSLILKLKDGSRFQYPVADFKDESGESLEGKGVTPDFEVPMKIDDLMTSRDPVLERALTWIEEKRK